MTTRMVRKQFYIFKHQDELLKRLAKERGLSESEIIRQAIEHEAAENLDHSASSEWKAIRDFITLARSKRSQETKAEPYRWNREEIYAERENRWLRKKDEE